MKVESESAGVRDTTNSRGFPRLFELRLCLEHQLLGFLWTALAEHLEFFAFEPVVGDKELLNLLHHLDVQLWQLSFRMTFAQQGSSHQTIISFRLFLRLLLGFNNAQQLSVGSGSPERQLLP